MVALASLKASCILCGCSTPGALNLRGIYPQQEDLPPWESRWEQSVIGNVWSEDKKEHCHQVLPAYYTTIQECPIGGQGGIVDLR